MCMKQLHINIFLLIINISSFRAFDIGAMKSLKDTFIHPGIYNLYVEKVPSGISEGAENSEGKLIHNGAVGELHRG